MMFDKYIFIMQNNILIRCSIRYQTSIGSG